MVLLLPFMSRFLKTPVDRLTVSDLTPRLLRRFLEHLEKDRACSGGTRNLRLGAIHSLAKFIGSHSPEYVAWCTEVRAVPFRKAAKTVMTYLDKPEMDVVLEAPDRDTKHGARDHVVLQFLYNTGARADEAAHVTIGDLTWGSPSSVRLVGNGNKIRHCPLWPKTAGLIKTLVGRPARKSFPKPSRTTADSVWYLHLGTTSGEASEHDRPISQSQTHQSPYDSAFDCLSFAPGGC